MALRPYTLALFSAAMLLIMSPRSALADAPAAGPLIRAKLVEPIKPKYPKDAQLRGQEGWVLVSFVIDDKGRTHDAFVIDSSGLKDFERAALNVVKRWRFEPATLRGVPVAQYDYTFKVNFQLSGGEPGARRRFVRDYRKVVRQIEAGNHDQAKVQIDALTESARWNLYEDAWLNWLSALYFDGVGDDEHALESIRRAIAYEGVYLPTELYGSALGQKYVLESQFGYLADALKTYDQIEKVGQAVPELEAHAIRLREIITSDQPIAAQGFISSAGSPWQFTLSRRSFQLAEVEGELSGMRIRCAHMESRFDELDVAWTIPDSWGDCHIYVHGTEGSRFKLLEMP